MRSVLMALALLLACPLAGCGSNDDTTGKGGSGGAPAEVQGCSADVKLLAEPADPSARGAWPVGVRTVSVSGLTVEVWYPALRGSEKGASPKTYDLRQWLPSSEQQKIPDADTLTQVSGAFADLPLDAERGPYPTVIFIHGTAGFRTQSLAQMEHWASRGFVVLAADHPGLYLGDMLALKLTKDLPGDIGKLVAALDAPSGDLAFLASHLDAGRRGLSGHSAGGMAIGTASSSSLPGVRVLMPLAAAGTTASSTLESTLVMGGKIDKVVAYDSVVKGYESSPKKKRLVGLASSGHLFPTGVCWLVNSSGKNMLEVAQQYQVQNAQFASGLFDCPDGQLSQAEQREIVDFATAAVLEETLHCSVGDPFGDVTSRFPGVAEYRQDL